MHVDFTGEKVTALLQFSEGSGSEKELANSNPILPNENLQVG